MAKVITIKGFIHAQRNWLNDSEYSYTHWTHDMSGHGYVLVCPHDVTVEIPDDFNPIAAEVFSLEAQKKAVREQFHRNTAELNEKISKLLSLENNPTWPEEANDDLPF